ncbi:MAG: hypothetical protein J7L37_03785 [Thermococcus sp.]|nr:hypothetical protein [Thermococcus sp.]
MRVERGGRFKPILELKWDGETMDEGVSLKPKKLAEEEVSEEELRELERLSKETLENGIPWRGAKKELGLKD